MGTAERKAREKLIRHQQILDAAYEVFNQVGFFAATMDQIAERAEIAKGTIYIYFKSKEEVYFSLLLNGQDILINMLTDIKKRQPPPDQLLGEMAKTLFRFYREHTSYFRIFMVMQQEDMQAKLSPELSQQINDQATMILNLLSNQIQIAVDTGAFDSVSPWHVANILWGSFNGITQLAITREQLRVGTMDTDDLLSLCFDMIHRGLSAKPQAPNTTANPQRSPSAKQET
jgi:AcrR family transcriptional regulator